MVLRSCQVISALLRSWEARSVLEFKEPTCIYPLICTQLTPTWMLKKNTTPTRVLPSFASFVVAGYTNPNPAPAEPSAETDADVEALTDELAMEFMGEYLTGDSWALQMPFQSRFLFDMRRNINSFSFSHMAGNQGWVGLQGGKTCVNGLSPHQKMMLGQVYTARFIIL